MEVKVDVNVNVKSRANPSVRSVAKAQRQEKACDNATQCVASRKNPPSSKQVS
jgi:hypothetical protein